MPDGIEAVLPPDVDEGTEEELEPPVPVEGAAVVGDEVPVPPEPEAGRLDAGAPLPPEPAAAMSYVAVALWPAFQVPRIWVLSHISFAKGIVPSEALTKPYLVPLMVQEPLGG
jgi:hypothetical protein